MRRMWWLVLVIATACGSDDNPNPQPVVPSIDASTSSKVDAATSSGPDAATTPAPDGGVDNCPYPPCY